MKLSFTSFIIIVLLAALRLFAQIWHEEPGAGGPSYISFLTSDESAVYAGTWGSGVYFSADKGTSWAPMNSGLTNTFIYALLVVDDCILAGTENGGIYTCSKLEKQWKQSNTGLNDKVVFTLVKNRSSIAASTWQGGIFTSVDRGATWETAGTGLGSSVIYSIHSSNEDLYAGTSRNGVYLSGDNGANWRNIGLGGMSVLCILTIDEYVLFGTWKDGIYRYLKKSNELIQIAQGSGEMVKSAAFKEKEKTIWCAKRARGVYTSSDYGHSWTCAGLEGYDVYSILALEDRIVAGTWGQGIFILHDNDTGWVNTGMLFDKKEKTGKKMAVTISESPVLKAETPVPKQLSSAGQESRLGLGQSRIMIIKACLKEKITICYTLKHDGRISIALYDYRGREKVKMIENATGGLMQKTDFPKQGLPPGVYFVLLTTLVDIEMAVLAYVE